MKYYDQKMNAIYFDAEELKYIFESPFKERLKTELLKDECSKELLLDKLQLVNDKEEKEIFSALYMFLNFYPKEESKIGFLLKDSADPKTINSLRELKISIKENDLTDFLFGHSDGFRSYQLKSYTGKTEINEFFEFLKKKLLHYCNDLGEINLLINMEQGGCFIGDFFQELYEKIKTIGLKGTGHILVSYNEEDKFDVMNTIYPILGTTRITHENFN